MHPQPWVLLLGALSHTGVGVAYGVSCGYGFQRFTFPGLRGLVASSGQARAERYVTEPISLRDGCHGSAKYARSSSPHQDRKEKKKKDQTLWELCKSYRKSKSRFLSVAMSLLPQKRSGQQSAKVEFHLHTGDARQNDRLYRRTPKLSTPRQWENS